MAESYGTAHAELLAQFDLPADTSPITPIMELETDSFSPDALRIGLKERMTPRQFTPSADPLHKKSTWRG
ncbi:MAG TPA: hypothetical protein VJJ70_13245 [Anaerolineales bacterium]|nr:hypothetical protein [Anaerolineales bacterium]